MRLANTLTFLFEDERGAMVMAWNFANVAAGARILVQVTINRRLRIGQDGHLDQSEAYDLS